MIHENDIQKHEYRPHDKSLTYHLKVNIHMCFSCLLHVYFHHLKSFLYFLVDKGVYIHYIIVNECV
jgi:hypothetical protein